MPTGLLCVILIENKDYLRRVCKKLSIVLYTLIQSAETVNKHGDIFTKNVKRKTEKEDIRNICRTKTVG